MRISGGVASFLLAFVLTACTNNTTVETGLAGTLLYERPAETNISQIVRIDLVDGTEQQISRARTSPGAIAAAESPDGSSVVHAEFRGDLGRVVLVLRDGDGGGSSVISDTSADETLPTWSPDCQSLFFARFTDGASSSIWRMNRDGSGREVHFASSEGFATGPHQSLHHERLLFHSSHDPVIDGTAIYSIVLGDGDPVLVTPAGLNARWGRWSPVADEIAFQETTLDGSMSRVSIIAGDGTNLRRLTEFEEDVRTPVWSPDGNWVAYRKADWSMVAVNVDTSEQVDLGVEGAASDWGPHGRTCPTSPSAVNNP